jgi:hypothetical protein
MKCNETLGKWCKNKHGASQIIDTFETYQGGTPYEVEVLYDGASEMYFKGGWSQFAEDHDLLQGFFMTFDFHIGTSKFDVKIYDCTQCQKEYEAEVHFH